MQNNRKCRGCEDILPPEDFDKTKNGNLRNKCRKCLGKSKVNAWMDKPKGYNWLLGYSLGERR